MILIFLLTLLVVAIPALNVFNARYIQRIALFIGVSQLALLALSGNMDNELSEIAVNGVNHVVSFTYSVVVEKIAYLLFSL
ncbi:MAG: hypothetical protein IPM95_07985 [Sphingobacteriales bacterium]|jgi:hypothetical protein|nr:hypothetical protein [Sphingobacteriales bacterium]